MELERGFTMVELIMVIVILGILVAMVGPRFFDRQVFDERLFYEESLAAVRYGQKLALASGCPIHAQIPGPSATSTGYVLTFSAPCSGAVTNPSGGNFEAELPAGVTIQQSLDVTFNPLGCVSSTNTCPSIASTDPAGAFPAEIGGFTFKVHAATGFIETTP
ncbi:prepilin-type N-terminal cleavage/methylation domain-containing protein [Pseudomonas sp. J452]|uniref:prepilin-type N-terminal cleavage/methylation domain-containing protein n=1 Tax=Pseudomonas sp. J452 TaxID=2898441 RepID=UPI0021AD7B1C|nr:prepilin-type N-terminal cleavage/methylation domain-containing protein [Pseudomonas sp. J452]UUY09884.1 prepilin-type N-terminal cleavage/methylation domain-containing protein [Pseudomonas sp. J452]